MSHEIGDGRGARQCYACHMSVSPRLAKRLNDTLGAEAAGELVNWLDEMRAEHRDLRESIKADFAEQRHAISAELHAVELRLAEKIHAVDTKVDQRHADLMRWSFVFWVGAVGAIAALAGVLRG